MRLLIKMKALGNFSFDNSINHKIQGFIYDNLYGSFFGDLHDKKGSKYFCFSNIFPIGDIKQGDEIGIIISSPVDSLLDILAKRISLLDKINIGNYSFSLVRIKKFNLLIKNKLNLISSTPIIIRIPKFKYEEYGIKSDRPYEYWRKEIGMDKFINAIEQNLIKKYEQFYGYSIDIKQIFESFELVKGVSLPIEINGVSHKLFGSIWKFSTIYINKNYIDLFRFMSDVGLGEMNTLGFGMLNKVDYVI